MRRKGRAFTVTLDVPEDADEADVIHYIHNSVASWKGSLHTEDPMFELDPDSVDVRVEATTRNRRQRHESTR